MNNPNTALIYGVSILGAVVIVVIGALVIFGPENSTVTTGAFTTIGTLAALILTSLLTLRASVEARAEAKVAATTATIAADKADVAAGAAIASKRASDKNAETLAHVAQQVDANTEVTEETHKIVNSQRTAMEAKIERLEAAITALAQEKASKALEDAHAEGGLTRIADAIETFAPPKEAPPDL